MVNKVKKYEESRQKKQVKKRKIISDTFLRFIMNAIAVLSGILMTIFAVYGILTGLFSSQERIRLFIEKFGMMAPAAFLVIQIVQIIIPIIPGGLTCVAGVLAFGPVMGFVYNYISIVIGSIIVFVLSRKFGNIIVRKIFSDKTYNKYSKWLTIGRKAEILFALAIFFPVAPDDFLCYLAGLTNMSYKKYILIIVLCKPLSILAYSMGVAKVLTFITTFLANRG